MAHLRSVLLAILAAVPVAGCAAPLLAPPLRYSATLTTTVSSHEPVEPEAAETGDDVDDVVVHRRRPCNPCRRRVYVTPYYYYYPYLQVY